MKMVDEADALVQESPFFYLCYRQINRAHRRRRSASTGGASVRGGARESGRGRWYLVLKAKVAFGMLLIDVTILK
jgi:hypothetical protein